MNQDAKTIRDAARLFVQYRLGDRKEPEAWVASHLFMDAGYLPAGVAKEVVVRGRALAGQLKDEFQQLLSKPKDWLDSKADSALPPAVARSVLNRLRRLLIRLPADESRSRIRVPVTIELATDRLVLADQTLLRRELEELLQRLVVPALAEAVQRNQAPYIKALCGSATPPIRFAVAPKVHHRPTQHEEEEAVRRAIRQRFRRNTFNLTYTEDDGWYCRIPQYHPDGRPQDFAAEVRPGGLVMFTPV